MTDVIRTDRDGRELGLLDAMEAHTGKGTLHKAFSVYVFTPDRKKILIQQRSQKKMLWPGAWANTCCSHPRSGETPEDAGARRLRDELGAECPLTVSGNYVYRAEYAGPPSAEATGGRRGVEHEFVTLLVGIAGENLKLHPNPDEVAEAKWISLEELTKDLKENSSQYAPWLSLGLQRIIGTHE